MRNTLLCEVLVMLVRVGRLCLPILIQHVPEIKGLHQSICVNALVLIRKLARVFGFQNPLVAVLSKFAALTVTEDCDIPHNLLWTESPSL